ncbi:MAG: hypothetical protein QG608_405 [Actinomycetota bacterium]|nr:hypothetical protein [Actinomycetota bacterium]
MPETDLQTRLAALTPQQREQFETMLRERTPAETVFPLSVFQQGMWFLEQLHPHNPAYLVPNAMSVRGDLDRQALARAVREIVRRHEALRTTFEVREGRPSQVVHADLPVEIRETDLRRRPGALAGAALQETIVEAAVGEPMDIRTGPLFRLACLRTRDEESVLVLTLHHLISDRWSIGVLLGELAALYEAFCAGRPSPLEELPVQYGDFATWQQQQLQSGAWKEDLEHWHRHLRGAPAALNLPTDRPRPAVQGFNGGTVPLEIPAPVMHRFAALAHGRGATTYMALLAAYTILLRRHSGQKDIVVAVPAACRDRVEIEGLIGYFVNTLPIRTDLGENRPVAEVIDRVREVCLQSYEHQNVPFDVLVADLKIPRDLSRPPVCQVSFSYGHEPEPTFALGRTEATRMRVRSGGARFDLELQVFDTGDGLNGWFEYDRDLFDESTIESLAAGFCQLVEQIAEEPDQELEQLVLPAPAEQGMLAGFNDTDHGWPSDRGWIHECFEDRVRCDPQAQAVRFNGEHLTYAELNDRANRLAHRLVRGGVGRDVLVGVALERSFELVIALMAVLKAGGAYLPLDPDYPAARLEHMITTARPRFLLTDGRTEPKLPQVEEGTELLRLDEIGLERTDETADASADDLKVPVSGEDLAYVIFTSGSTGVPKGVMNVHAGIRNRLLWMQETLALEPGDRVLQKTPFSFDVSVWEFFWPLMTGATLVVARPGGHRDSAYLVKTIQEEKVTTIHFVPSMLRMFLQEPFENCTSLRRVVCSGEALPRDVADRFLKRSEAELHNLYGPTEAAVDVTHWPCGRQEGNGPVPIGRPIANTRLHVLDPAGRQVPIGVGGELHIAGRNLARGYLNQPELTAERFIGDPFDPTPGARLYKTGDLARFRRDGALEFLGRIDHQVKLRGLRIEPGEIETALVQCRGVREAVVVPRELRAGDVRLAAYLICTGAQAPEPGDLNAQLRVHLPEYMIPSFYEVLGALPLTPNGKVDRAALPAPGSTRRESGVPYAAPEDDLEKTVADLWCEVLGAERVGRHDNFFELGGHSLLLAEVRLQLSSRLSREISLIELFQHPTVSALAEHLVRGTDAQQETHDDAERRAAERRQALHRRRRTANRRIRSQS